MGVGREFDSLGPFVAEFQGESQVASLFGGRATAAAAFVGFAPVGGVDDEVEDCFCWVREGCFGGYAEFAHGVCWKGFGLGLTVRGVGGRVKSLLEVVSVPSLDVSVVSVY